MHRRILAILPLVVACSGKDETPWEPHGPVADDIFAPMGQPLPNATEEQRATFERGLAVAQHRFRLDEGLGPAFNVTFCGSCHEKPDFGGSAGLYRNFFLAGRTTADGAFFFAESADNDSGVIRVYNYGEEHAPRPEVDDGVNIFTQRNPIPFFGVGLLAELTSDEILKRADENDRDGDGVSGRPNFDRGFVGRFGMKSQTTSIEGFIRGPLMNHLGITTDPLLDEERAELPVDSSSSEVGSAWLPEFSGLSAFLQAAAPDGPLTDDDGIEDPEMTNQELFDLVSWSMLLAAPEPEPLNDERLEGMRLFDQIGCDACHTPRLQGPRGPLPVYSDLLVHDMGPDLADGLVMKDASGSEFRTQPLWGLSPVGPYLHDGRAETIAEAIAWHGGEAERAREGWLSLDGDQQALILEFLESLGGRSQKSVGLIPPNTPIAEVGAWGGPVRALSTEEEAQFLRGRTFFDKEFGLASGLGGPRYNGDSCRACHFEPVVGGAGPRGVNVMRHGILSGDAFVPPAVGTILHKQTSLLKDATLAQAEVSVYEHRQTPHLFGLGLIDDIPEEAILALADPEDADGDGISGKPSWTDGQQLGRFGWKGQVPSIDEFARDAITMELGMTLPAEEGLTFGRIHDNDAVADPELPLSDAADLAFYLRTLAPPPRTEAEDPQLAAAGEVVFDEVGCASCHTPSLAGVPLYSDLLLHEILPPDAVGIEEVSANMREFRTPPLWGLALTPPYLHSGVADTLEQAILAHEGEATGVRAAFVDLDAADQAALIAFLETL